MSRPQTGAGGDPPALLLWSFDAGDRRRPNLLDQMPVEVRESAEFERRRRFYLSRAGGEMTSWGAEMLAGMEVYALLAGEASDDAE